jgi:DNA-binding response OmpR family regulator
MSGTPDFKADILSMINDRMQITYSELSSLAFSMGMPESKLKDALKDLESTNVIASRSSGGMMTYYILQDANALRRVLIVEDDKNINKLMALTIGRGFEVEQVYDGKDAIQSVKSRRPDLVILDLMLPGADGLEVCQTIKSDPKLSGIIVIIVSAMDATPNRLKTIKFGADYYIKKPFDPEELRSLVTIFLKKKGKRFDPLIDLPNEDKISEEMETALKQGSLYTIGRIKVEGLGNFAKKFGPDSAFTILRLVSQLFQDNVKGAGAFVGFLDNDDFVIAGEKDSVVRVVNEVDKEFHAVKNFIYQSKGYKPVALAMNYGYESERPELSLSYKKIQKSDLTAKRSEIIKNKNAKSIGSYTYEELRKMLGSNNLDIVIRRDAHGAKLSIGKSSEDDEDPGDEADIL